MAGLARRAALVSLARLCNQGLALLGPIILVRLLPVAEFGTYRRFYLYFNLVSVIAVLAINSSLLYFVPRQPDATWRIVRRCAMLVAVSSSVAAAMVFGADFLSRGSVIGAHVNQVLIYMLLFVNLDFWEHLALARKRPLAVLGYTTGRLLARMTAVLITAALTADADAIIAALIGVEAVRIVLSAVVWARLADEPTQGESAPTMQEILKYSLPVGLGILVLAVNTQAGALVIDRFVGEIGLAYFTVGGYVYLIVGALRNSISDVLLPEMSSNVNRASGVALQLWQRSTVVFSILLLPVALVLACFAEPVITAVFSRQYLPAVPVFQVYLLVLLRECFDFDLALRAAGQTRKALAGHVMTLAINLSLALLLVPLVGVVGAAIALVVSRALAAIYLAQRVAGVAGLKARALIPWKDLLRVLTAMSIAALVLVPPVLDPQYGWLAIALACLVFTVVFICLLRAFNVSEVRWLSTVIGRRLQLS